MQDESRFGTYTPRPVRRRRRPTLRFAIIIAILVISIAAGIGLTVARQSDSVKVEFGDAVLTVSAPDQWSTTVSYSDMLRVSLYTDPDYGKCAGGTQKAGCKYGTWHNAQWETYRLCVHEKVKTCIVVETSGGIFAFNAGSEKDTHALKAELDERLIAQAAAA